MMHALGTEASCPCNKGVVFLMDVDDFNIDAIGFLDCPNQGPAAHSAVCRRGKPCRLQDPNWASPQLGIRA